MAWIIKFEKRAYKSLENLGSNAQCLIRDYIDTRLIACENPRDLGKPLRHDKSGLWRYRVDKYRIICKIEDSVMTILVIGIGKRDRVYD